MMTASVNFKISHFLRERIDALIDFALKESKNDPKAYIDVINTINLALREPLRDNEFKGTTFDQIGMFKKETLSSLRNDLRGILNPNYNVFVALNIVEKSDEKSFNKHAEELRIIATSKLEILIDARQELAKYKSDILCFKKDEEEKQSDQSKPTLF